MADEALANTHNIASKDELIITPIKLAAPANCCFYNVGTKAACESVLYLSQTTTEVRSFFIKHHIY